MTCPAILASGRRKGETCGRMSKTSAYCGLHKSKAPPPLPEPEKTVCVICQDCVDDDSLVLPCKHEFHMPCVETWFRKEQKACCPLCRQVVPGAIIPPKTKEDIDLEIQQAQRDAEVEMEQLLRNQDLLEQLFQEIARIARQVHPEEVPFIIIM